MRLVQGRADQETVYGDDPAAMGRRWEAEGAAWLHVVDLDGAFSGKPAHLPLIERIAQAVRIPIQVGGGIRSLESIISVLHCGAKRVILGTQAVGSPLFLREACQRFRGQILLGIDARGGYIATEGWTKPTHLKAVDFAQQVTHFPLGGIVYTDIFRDGMLAGPNLSALCEMADVVSLPLIASGGISSLSDVRAIMGLETRGVGGMIIGKALYSGKIDLSEAIALVRKGREGAG